MRRKKGKCCERKKAKVALVRCKPRDPFKHRTDLRKRGILFSRFQGNGVRSPVEDLVDVLLTKLAARVVVFHYRAISAPLQQVLHLVLAELRALGLQESAELRQKSR